MSKRSDLPAALTGALPGPGVQAPVFPVADRRRNLIAGSVATLSTTLLNHLRRLRRLQVAFGPARNSGSVDRAL